MHAVRHGTPRVRKVEEWRELALAMRSVKTRRLGRGLAEQPLVLERMSTHRSGSAQSRWGAFFANTRHWVDAVCVLQVQERARIAINHFVGLRVAAQMSDLVPRDLVRSLSRSRSLSLDLSLSLALYLSSPLLVCVNAKGMSAYVTLGVKRHMAPTREQ